MPLRVDLTTGEIINRADPIHVFRCGGAGGCVRGCMCVFAKVHRRLLACVLRSVCLPLL